ncbi:SH3 domain-containing protein, partial [Cribrihabitans sp. XS_ASV171]
MKRLNFLIAALALVLLPGLATAQDEPRVERVQFDAGTSGTTIRDRIKGYEVVRYVLGAKAGQHMTVSLDTAHTSTYFNVIQPSAPQGPALAVSEMAGTNPMVPEINRFDGTLPESGDYGIEVWMYRSAARRGEVADFTLQVSIGGAASAAPSGDYADGMSGGPDYWAVNVDTTLNVHSGPSTSAPTVARLPNGMVVQNLGCQMAEGRKWCQVADGDARGWVAGEFLVEAAAPGGGAAAPAGTPTDAEQACLRDVTAVTNNPDVVLLGSEFSEAGTLVRVGVGEARAPWKCIAYSDGTTAGIEFMG